jgi:hypothetical protein
MSKISKTTDLNNLTLEHYFIRYGLPTLLQFLKPQGPIIQNLYGRNSQIFVIS